MISIKQPCRFLTVRTAYVHACSPNFRAQADELPRFSFRSAQNICWYARLRLLGKTLIATPKTAQSSLKLLKSQEKRDQKSKIWRTQNLTRHRNWLWKTIIGSLTAARSQHDVIQSSRERREEVQVAIPKVKLYTWTMVVESGNTNIILFLKAIP